MIRVLRLGFHLFFPLRLLTLATYFLVTAPVSQENRMRSICSSLDEDLINSYLAITKGYCIVKGNG